MGAGEEALKEHRYIFRSMDKQWTVSVKSFALSLETSKYTDFEDFFSRLMIVLKSAEPLIDADFYTRVGLRYINRVPVGDDGDPRGWINGDLIGPFENNVLGSVSKYASLVSGSLENGNYTMRHGIGEDEAAAAKGNKREYTLDFDYYRETVEASKVSESLKEFNRTNFNFFNWCLGPKARAVLGDGKPK